VKRFYGHVTNEYGKPIPFTHIRADFNGAILADTLTRQDGSFELLVPFHKNQMITLMAENFEYVSSTVTVSENDNPRFRMRHRHHLFAAKEQWALCSENNFKTESLSSSGILNYQIFESSNQL